jgi:hypothetical protein
MPDELPEFWESADCGKAFWFSSVSGIEAVVPSTRVTRRPFQSHVSGARPSIA